MMPKKRIKYLPQETWVCNVCGHEFNHENQAKIHEQKCTANHCCSELINYFQPINSVIGH